MNLKKFFAPVLVSALVLSAFWITGLDRVVQPKDELQKNIRKYTETQRRIFYNYVESVDINKLYKKSIKGFVKGIDDSTAQFSQTPLDTSFTNLQLDGLMQAKKKFKEAYLYMAQTYPDEDMNKHTVHAIRAMLSMLDPHSVYIEPRESELIASNFKGSFSGIGIMFNIIQDTITVITPISGGPSATLGIQSGDKIIAIEDSTAIDFSNREVINTLRGPKGSEVDVTIKRPGQKELLYFTITRDEIPLYTVDTAYMVDEKTGYIKINRFAATTHKEFMKAMDKLQGKGMNRLIIDLRRNPGGYLGQAFAIASEFFPRGTEIVSTKSRHPRFTNSYTTSNDGSFLNIPLIVLVNSGSASASEIVSGAIQDHDRGLIVGQRTFGKGLVQQQYQLVDESNIRVTIARYYTPSGRLIQKPYNPHDKTKYALEIYKRENDAVTDVKHFLSHVPDSLKHYTDAGRIVYGGGGIVPDHIVQPDTTDNWSLPNYMRKKRIGFEFVTSYLEKHKDFKETWKNNFDKFLDEFSWSEQNLQTVFSMLKQKGVTVVDTISNPIFTKQIKLKHPKLYEKKKKNNTFANTNLLIPPEYFKKVEQTIGGVMKAELARQIWGIKKFYPVYNDEFRRALEISMTLWNEVNSLKQYASTHHKPQSKKDEITNHSL